MTPAIVPQTPPKPLDILPHITTDMLDAITAHARQVYERHRIPVEETVRTLWTHFELASRYVPPPPGFDVPPHEPYLHRDPSLISIVEGEPRVFRIVDGHVAPVQNGADLVPLAQYVLDTLGLSVAYAQRRQLMLDCPVWLADCINWPAHLVYTPAN
jgi:hypothetical protein